MNLLLLTYDYPFGNGETFLEDEIQYASKLFDAIYIISTSKNTKQTRKVPKNVIPVKIDRSYRLLECLIYALIKIFSKDSLEEINNVCKMDNRPRTLYMIKRWITTWMIEKRYDLVIETLNINKGETVAYSYWLDSSAYYLSRNKNDWKKVISRVHGYEIRDDESYMPFRPMIDSGLDNIYFISSYTQNEYNRIMEKLVNNQRENMGKQIISRLGVEEGVLNINEKDKIFRIVTCSSIYKLKRLDLLVDALQYIDKSCNVEWRHFGWGVDGDKIIKMCIEKLSGIDNLSWNIEGWKENTEILNYYSTHNIDIFINLSDREGIPVSIMEAMSFGIPCMARDVGGNSEIIIDKVNGYLLHKDINSIQIGEKINKLIFDKESGITNICKEDVLSFFKNHYLADVNYNDFFNSLIK